MPQNPNRQQRRHSPQVVESAIPKRLQFDYVRSNFCRVVHASGAYGGATGEGLIYMALYSEHHKIPATGELTVDQATRTIREERKVPGIATWIREVEVEALLSLEVARSLREWLDDEIKKFESADQIFRVESDTAKETA